MDRIMMFIATGAYAGYLPKAPGTWGSVLGVLLWFALTGLSLPNYLLVAGALFIVGVITAGAAEKILDHGDPGVVVIDEIVGQMLALSLAPAHPAAGVAGFLLFRLFDILKPFPVSWFDDHIHGGAGIMLDDVAAGLYAFIVLQIGLRIFGATTL